MSDNGYVMSVHADCAKYFYQTKSLFEAQLITWYLIFIMDFLTRVYIYIYVYMSLLAGRYMFNWEYTGICCYLTCISLHLPNLNFFILLGFFVVNVN